MKILVDRDIPFIRGVAEQIGETEYISGKAFGAASVKDKDVLIVRTVAYIGKEILENSNLSLICSATIGFDHIDTQYCDSHNITWFSSPGCNADSVEQYVTASLLLTAEKYSFSLNEKTIGIIGVGNVGGRVAKACRKMGMKVLLNDPPLEAAGTAYQFSDIETIQDEADIITFHIPLTKKGQNRTYHLADSSFFNRLRRKPIIINSSRGAVIETEALKNAIKEGLISTLIIDCWENEPNIDLELLAMAEIATPHIAGYSADGKWTATKMSIDNICRFYNINSSKIKLSHLPAPLQPIIDLNATESVNKLCLAVLHTYNPKSDTEKLKADPHKFSFFRSNYPLRREYKAFKVINSDKNSNLILREMGFKIE